MERQIARPAPKIATAISYLIVTTALLMALGFTIAYTLGDQLTVPFNF
jgi:hypothetical protein